MSAFPAATFCNGRPYHQKQVMESLNFLRGNSCWLLLLIDDDRTLQNQKTSFWTFYFHEKSFKWLLIGQWSAGGIHYNRYTFSSNHKTFIFFWNTHNFVVQQHQKIIYGIIFYFVLFAPLPSSYNGFSIHQLIPHEVVNRLY